MIGGIDSQVDIDLYLTVQEVGRLATEVLDGVLVKIHCLKRQGLVRICVDDVRAYVKGSGIGIDDKAYWNVQDDFAIDLFMSEQLYHDLLQRGVVGTRHQMRDGSKVTVRDVSRLSGLERLGLETLEFYRDNKDRLLDRLE